MQLKPVVVTLLKQARSSEIVPTVDLSKYGLKDWDFAAIEFPHLIVQGERIKLTNEDWDIIFDDLMRQEFEGF